MPLPSSRLRGPVPTALALLGILTLLALFGARAFHERDLAIDDAYILTRYASHLAEGHGFRWNVTSPPVEGFTSPLFVMLLAGLLRLGVAPTAAAAALSIIAITGLVALLVTAAGPTRPGFSIATLPTAFLLVDPGIAVHASRGLETSAFFLVAAAQVAIAGAMVRRPAHTTGYGMAAVSFLLVLTRPDGALIVAVCWLAAALALRGRSGDGTQALLHSGVALALVGAAFAMWKLWYFGALLPTAYYVKAVGVGWAGVTDAMAFVADYSVWLVGSALAALGTIVMALSRLPDRWRHVHLETVIPMAVTLPWLVYSAKIVHEQGFTHRFSFVLVPLAALAATHALRTAFDVATERRWIRPGILATAGTVAVIGCALMFASPVSHTLQTLRGAPPSDANVIVFSRLGRAIASAGLGEQISFLNSAAGAAPFLAGARHVDSFGLATREFSKVVSIERRLQMIADSAFDVIEMPFLPASPGAESVDDEPMRFTDYWKRVEEVGRNARQYEPTEDGMDAWFATAHSVMRYLRDHTTLVGGANYSGNVMHIYVSRESHHYQQLVTTLSRELDIPAEQLR
ncbi:MAG TPA: hypothetical protein PKW63_09870 [Vicinamibacterales bacterium]|nr:hypothetical protein [Acidobacteriota bacterium]HQX82053.1 hypothetical protein [Vicinamibacterales bacterium]